MGNLRSRQLPGEFRQVQDERTQFSVRCSAPCLHGRATSRKALLWLGGQGASVPIPSKRLPACTAASDPSPAEGSSSTLCSFCVRPQGPEGSVVTWSAPKAQSDCCMSGGPERHLPAWGLSLKDLLLLGGSPASRAKRAPRGPSTAASHPTGAERVPRGPSTTTIHPGRAERAPRGPSTTASRPSRANQDSVQGTVHYCQPPQQG